MQLRYSSLKKWWCSMQYTQQLIESNIVNTRSIDENNLRKQLAYLYRIFYYYNWCDLIVTHLSVRVPNEMALLILPFGLAFNEVTPENLVKVDFEGNIIDSPCGFQINKNGSIVHRVIYKRFSDIACILHTHSPYGVTVSNLDEELLILDQISMMFYSKVGYHNFDTIFTNDNEQKQLLNDMHNKQCMILKNHGLISVGKNITEAFWFHYYLELTCKIHVLTRSTGSKIQYPLQNTIINTFNKYEIWRNKNDHIKVSDSELLFDAAKRQIGYIFD